jgi:hypothetical protein
MTGINCELTPLQTNIFAGSEIALWLFILLSNAILSSLDTVTMSLFLAPTPSNCKEMLFWLFVMFTA